MSLDESRVTPSHANGYDGYDGYDAIKKRGTGSLSRSRGISGSSLGISRVLLSLS